MAYIMNTISLINMPEIRALDRSKYYDTDPVCDAWHLRLAGTGPVLIRHVMHGRNAELKVTRKDISHFEVNKT